MTDFEKLVQYVRGRAEHDLSPSIARSAEAEDRALLERIVLYALNGIGKYVGTDGSIYDPAPPSAIPQGGNAYWVGSKRGRYGR